MADKLDPDLALAHARSGSPDRTSSRRRAWREATPSRWSAATGQWPTRPT